LFEGQLKLEDILKTPKKLLLALRDARVDRLIEEKKSQAKQQEDLQRQMGT
jgi:hypothetical protein